MAEMKPEETRDSSGTLQRWHVYVQVHSVDSLDLQRHVLPENFRDRPWYAHFRLRYDSDPSGSTAATAA